MKKSLITLALIACTVTAFSQGALNFTTRVVGTMNAPVYLPELSDSSIEQHGQSAIGIPTGTVVYTGGVIPAAQGSQFSAQLFAGSLGTADADLSPLTPITTFRTATTAGHAGNIIAVTIAGGVPGVAAGSSARLQMRAWDNVGGTITSWAQADALSKVNTAYRLGDGLSFNSLPLTASPNPPADSIGMTSFNLHTVVPEPSTIALGVLGLGALVLFRRRK